MEKCGLAVRVGVEIKVHQAKGREDWMRRDRHAACCFASGGLLARDRFGGWLVGSRGDERRSPVGVRD